MHWMRAVDRIVHRYLTRSWTEPMRHQYLANLRFMRGEESEQRALRAALDQMDTKASGTLTHISMMIAAMGVTAISEIVDHDSERFVCYLTIGLYLILAVMCLRCMTVIGVGVMTGNPDQLLDNLLRESIYRRELYTLANSATTLLTGLVLVLIYFFYFY
jgi:hypothetical protein